MIKNVLQPVSYANLTLFLEICCHSFITKLPHCHFGAAGINLKIKKKKKLSGKTGMNLVQRLFVHKRAGWRPFSICGELK